MGQRSRQNPIDIPEPSGAIVRRSEKNIVVNRAELQVLNQGPWPTMVVSSDAWSTSQILVVPSKEVVAKKRSSWLKAVFIS